MIDLSDEDFLYLKMSEVRLGIDGLVTSHTGKVLFESTNSRYSAALFDEGGKVGYAIMDCMWFWIMDQVTGELEPYPLDSTKYGYDLSEAIEKERERNLEYSRDHSCICVDKIIAKGFDTFDVYTNGVLNYAYFTDP